MRTIPQYINYCYIALLQNNNYYNIIHHGTPMLRLLLKRYTNITTFKITMDSFIFYNHENNKAIIKIKTPVYSHHH